MKRLVIASMSLVCSLFSHAIYANSFSEAVDAVKSIDTSNITEMYDSVKDFSLDDLSGMTSGVKSLMLKDTSGTAEKGDTSGTSDKQESQKARWSYDDEYAYGLASYTTDLTKYISCAKYRVVGFCISYTVNISGIHFHYHTAVEHFVRDFNTEVLSQLPTESITETSSKTVLPSSTDSVSDLTLIYPYTWKLARDTGRLLNITEGINSTFAKMQSSEGQVTYSKKTNYTYRDAQVSGNIEGSLANAGLASTIGVFGWCTSPAAPGLPYFNSALDQFSWRWLATSETILMGLYQVKYRAWDDIGASYGSTMPRSGYISQSDNFKAATVAAFRATSIPAENRSLYSGLAGLHIYTPISPYAVGSFTGSKYLTPQDATYGLKMAMVYPYKNSSEYCTRYDSSSLKMDDTRGKKFNKNNPYNSAIFKVWRPYRCCRKQGHELYSVVSPGPIGLPK